MERSRSSAGAGVFNKDQPLLAVSENQIPHGEPEHDRHEHAAVVRHDGQHQQVPDGGVDPEQEPDGDPRRSLSAVRLAGEERRPDGVGGRRGRELGGGGEELEAEAAVLHVLVEEGEEEDGEEGEGVGGPRVGLP